MGQVIVIGSGIAGLTAALRLARCHEVTLVTKGALGESNTEWAQGGIAGVIGTEDTAEAHAADTLTAGAGHCDESAVRVLCEAGGAAVVDLAEAGVEFDSDRTGAWARGMEGAHSHPRIFHSAGDATGRAIIVALTGRLRAEATAGRVRVLEQTMLVDLVTEEHGARGECTGITALRGGRLERLSADAVVLATGGAGQLFAHTTNPAAATGDGLAAALRAGARVRDLEFFQFHPTALAGPGLLISEAVRGAGALLVDEQGRRFMREVDDRAELAPRDVVALALHRRSAAQDGRPCFLDARRVPEVAARFPSITRGLAARGLDPEQDLIPVTPAAHYFMGGIATDLEGRTSIGRLFAVGEVACTGVHGANRLASNSLLEGAVFGERATRAIEAELGDVAGQHRANLGSVSAGAVHTPGRAGTEPARTGDRRLPRRAGLTRAELRELTWAHLGVERHAAGLRLLLSRLGEAPVTAGHLTGADMRHDSATDMMRHDSLVDRVETSNLALIAAHMARHALARPLSLGAHTRTDTPPASALAPRATSTDLLEETTAC
ncbi:L-aspartate oxidase [Brevibacterium renqingii]|uniref:L-aspartate oxidase n=1 Tax=Brevibacterium renqingii TaxID=2776916 RepID=UPI001AE07CD1|nr:L-aspartate oxidase [Brevibacterium renqingii]